MARGKRSKDCDIDLGLAVLAATNTPPHTARYIAAFCGCSPWAITLIERKALRKMRIRFSQYPEILEALKVMATQ